jgi:hypothetical protein
MPGTSLPSLSLEGILSSQSIHSISTSTKNVERKSMKEKEIHTGAILEARKLFAIRVGWVISTDCPAHSDTHTYTIGSVLDFIVILSLVITIILTKILIEIF